MNRYISILFSPVGKISQEAWTRSRVLLLLLFLVWFLFTIAVIMGNDQVAENMFEFIIPNPCDSINKPYYLTLGDKIHFIYMAYSIVIGWILLCVDLKHSKNFIFEYKNGYNLFMCTLSGFYIYSMFILCTRLVLIPCHAVRSFSVDIGAAPFICFIILFTYFFVAQCVFVSIQERHELKNSSNG